MLSINTTQENSIFPSVRCGLEMAILNAIAERQGCSLLNIIQPWRETEKICEKSNVKICGLIDSTGTPAEVAVIASALVEEGFSALKLKVRLMRNKNCNTLHGSFNLLYHYIVICEATHFRI